METDNNDESDQVDYTDDEDMSAFDEIDDADDDDMLVAPVEVAAVLWTIKQEFWFTWFFKHRQTVE